MTLTQKLETAMWLRSFPWDWFSTETFRKNLSRETCHRVFLDWIALLERYEGKPIHWARMIEKAKTTGRLHMHALIAGPRRISTQKAEELWQRLAGTAEIAKYDPKLRGVEYMLKTIEDDPDYDLDLFLPKPNPLARRANMDATQTQRGEGRISAKEDRADSHHFVPKGEPFSSLTTSSSSVAFEPLLSAIDAAPLVKLHPGTLLRWAREGRVPHHRMSRKVFFRASELETWCTTGCNMTTTVSCCPTLTGARE